MEGWPFRRCNFLSRIADDSSCYSLDFFVGLRFWVCWITGVTPIWVFARAGCFAGWVHCAGRSFGRNLQFCRMFSIVCWAWSHNLVFVHDFGACYPFCHLCRRSLVWFAACRLRWWVWWVWALCCCLHDDRSDRRNSLSCLDCCVWTWVLDVFYWF